MARLDGKQASYEASLEVAKLAAAAAHRAPQTTARLELRSEIVTGEDQAPIVEFFESVIPVSPVTRFDFYSYNHFLKSGTPPPILLLGADLTRSEMGWDCGACGFESCAEFNSYAAKNRSQAALFGGPTCNWKAIDFGMACDFACAAISQYRYEGRAMGTLGGCAAAVGYLAGCSAVIGIPVGPPGDFLWFSRGENVAAATQAEQRQWLMQSTLVHWLSFSGSTKPCMKTRPDWWKDMEFPKWESLSGEEQKAMAEAMQKAMGVAMKHAPRVAQWYEKKGQKAGA
ncbi:MAG: DUF2148 domain-containing protein [bacterium]